jgi:uncharacterized protein (TIGR02271 family)
MARSIVAVFASRPEAERVAEALTNEGIARGDIRVADTATRQEYEGGGKRDTSFWSWLFGSSDEESWSPDIDYYNQGLGRGGAVLKVQAEDRDAERVQRIVEAHGARVEGGERTAAAGQERDVIPVVEEQLRIGKRAVTRGGVRVYSHVSERPVEEDVRLREEHVRLDRRPVDRPVGAAGSDVFRERSIEINETAEEPVVAKEARIIEEVVVSKEVQERTAKVRDTVRRTDVEVDRAGAKGDDARGSERDFRAHCEQTFGGEGLSYEQCAPAYQYGYTLGSDREKKSDWDSGEAETRRRWEERNPGTWSHFRSAIHYGWQCGRGEQRAA